MDISINDLDCGLVSEKGKGLSIKWHGSFGILKLYAKSIFHGIYPRGQWISRSMKPCTRFILLREHSNLSCWLRFGGSRHTMDRTVATVGSAGGGVTSDG
jgi:hypothetical protein